MKRFYKMVTHAGDDRDGYEIHLDGRPVKTPSGTLLRAPSRALADALVAEWAGQGEQIDMNTMPLTQMLGTALDRVSREYAAIRAEVLGYFDTDLLCYHTPPPSPLAAREAENWGRFLAWFEGRFGIALAVTTGLSALSHPPAAHHAVAAAVDALDIHRFTILQIVTSLSGSLILALCFMDGAASAEEIFEAITLDDAYRAEIYNESLYGAAPQQEQRHASIRSDLDAAARYLVLLSA